MRIQKYLSEQGICSRREAEALIKRGLVSVNGVVVRAMGIQIEPAKDRVEVLDQARK
jgi:23S rRNA pseudouridine2605 synthase